MRIFCTVVLAALASIAAAQETPPTPEVQPKKVVRPDIPGTFSLEFGFNRMTERPNRLNYGFWGSRTLNIYYQYDLRLFKSKFSLHPGLGVGMERFKLQDFQQPNGNGTTTSRRIAALTLDELGNTRFADAVFVIYDGDSLNSINTSLTYSTKKSMMIANYLDIPLELRFTTNPDNPNRSFRFAVFGRVGVLFDSGNKIKYNDDGENRVMKNKQRFNLSPIRYSAGVKFGIGAFQVFGYYNINTLWEAGRGPDQTEARSYTIGLSLAAF